MGTVQSRRPSPRVIAARRRAAIVLILFIVALAVMVPRLLAAQPFSAPEVHVVKTGETLWKVAQAHTAGDPRRYVYELRELNNLTSAQVFPGQSLTLPGH